MDKYNKWGLVNLYNPKLVHMKTKTKNKKNITLNLVIFYCKKNLIDSQCSLLSQTLHDFKTSGIRLSEIQQFLLLTRWNVLQQGVYLVMFLKLSPRQIISSNSWSMCSGV